MRSMIRRIMWLALIGGSIINFARAGGPQANMVAYNYAKRAWKLSHARLRWKDAMPVSASTRLQLGWSIRGPTLQR